MEIDSYNVLCPYCQEVCGTAEDFTEHDPFSEPSIDFECEECGKKFVRIFQEVFGQISRENIFVRRQGFIPLFDIFYKNFRTEKEEKVKERLSLIVGKSDILMYLNMQGREAQQTIRSLMVNYINRGKSYVKNAVV